MITYAHLVIWVWTLALVATLVALGIAWRAIARADAAVGQLRSTAQGLGSDAGSVALSAEAASTRAHRTALVERSEALLD